MQAIINHAMLLKVSTFLLFGPILTGLKTIFSNVNKLSKTDFNDGYNFQYKRIAYAQSVNNEKSLLNLIENSEKRNKYLNKTV